MRRVCVGLFVALVGCDPTSGLSDSADAALPQLKRYVDGPGQRLTEGPWNRVVVDLDAETSYHLGARRLDDEQPTFHLFGADAQQGCTVTPNTGTWLMSKPLAAPFRLLPYLEGTDERGRGRLRFTTLDCHVQDVVVQDAGRPRPYEHGYLVPTGQGYTFVDPWAGTTRELATRLQGSFPRPDATLLWADDRLKTFSNQFEPGSEWGTAVAAVVPLGQGFLVEDSGILHHITIDGPSLDIEAEEILPDTCSLQASEQLSFAQTSGWLVAAQPCGNPRPSLIEIDLFTFEQREALELPFEAEPRYTRAVVQRASVDEPPTRRVVFYLTNVDDAGLGTLWAWQEGIAEPVHVGDHADLASAYVEGPDSEWAGGAEVSYRLVGDRLVHDWIHFTWDGTTVIIAGNVLRSPSTGDLLVNFDGVAGDLPLFSSESYAVLAEGVAPDSSDATSYVGGRYRARVDHFDGQSGRAMLGQEGSLTPSAWQAVGRDVPPDQLRFAWFMPAVIFIENWDARRRSGSLVVYNYELDARATIAEGVSSFDLTSYPWDGVVYAVPRGAQPGIWFAKAK